MIRAILCSVFLLTIMQNAIAQQDTLICEPDSAFLASGAIVFPTPFVNDTLGIGIPQPACINDSFEVIFFLNAPPTITFAGVDIIVNWIRVDSVTNLPAGLDIECSVDNCQIFPDSLACIRLSGTPDPSNMPGDFELLIFMTASTNIFPTLPIQYPSETLGAPGSYIITLLEEGACDTITSTVNQYKEVAGLNIFPNPVRNELAVEWQSQFVGSGTIGLTTLTGQRVYNEELKVQPGLMRHDLILSPLVPGIYFLDFRSDNINFRRKVLKL